MEKKRELSASEAIYGFCGWLTGCVEKTVMSSTDDCAIIAEKIKQFCETNNLANPSSDFYKILKHPKN